LHRRAGDGHQEVRAQPGERGEQLGRGVLGLLRLVEEHPRPLDAGIGVRVQAQDGRRRDRKSTRLNSSHVSISYAVVCVKKKKTDAEGGSAMQVPNTVSCGLVTGLALARRRQASAPLV